MAEIQIDRVNPVPPRDPSIFNGRRPTTFTIFNNNDTPGNIAIGVNQGTNTVIPVQNYPILPMEAKKITFKNSLSDNIDYTFNLNNNGINRLDISVIMSETINLNMPTSL